MAHLHLVQFTSLLSFMTSWFTPTSLFLLLNLVIGTIAIISRFNTPPNEETRRPFARAPSLIDRVKSINLSFNRYQLHNSQPRETADTTPYHPPQLERFPSLLERVKSIKFPSLYGYRPDPETDSGTGDESDHHVTRSKSKSRVARPETTEVKEEEKMKKSTSERAMHDETIDDKQSGENKRVASTRLDKTVSFCGEDDGVDAKADDFINKFKRQLKMQRLESLLRYRDMIKGKSTSN